MNGYQRTLMRGLWATMWDPEIDDEERIGDFLRRMQEQIAYVERWRDPTSPLDQFWVAWGWFGEEVTAFGWPQLTVGHG